MDNYDRWQQALAGEKLDLGERGDPPCGYFRRSAGRGRWEAFAVFRDDGDVLCCARNLFGNGDGMTVGEIDEMFMGDVYAVPYDVYVAVAESGADWPPIYTTRLTTAQIKSGTVWTPAIGQAIIDARQMDAPLQDAADNPRAVSGNNNPPEELPIERQFADRINNAATRVKEWLASIGGIPRTKEEADKVAEYATKFGQLHSDAETAFKAEKEPWLKGGREVDAKWRFRDEAMALRKTYLGIADKWISAEKARLAAEAKKAHDEAVAAAKREADALGEPVAEIAPPKPPKVTLGNTKTVSQRERKVWIVKDLPAFVGYLLKLDNVPPDLVETCEKIAHRLGSAGVNAPGIEQEERRSAA